MKAEVDLTSTAEALGVEVELLDTGNFILHNIPNSVSVVVTSKRPGHFVVDIEE